MIRLRRNIFLVALAVFSFSNNFPHSLEAANSDAFAVQGSGVFNNVDLFRIDQSGNVFISSYNATVGVNTPHTSITNQGAYTFVGNLTLSNPADINFGSTSSAISTTTTAGTSQGLIWTALLLAGPGSGAGASLAASEGSVLCATTTASSGVVTVFVCGSPAATLNDQPVVGVAAAAASTGSVVNVMSYGWTLALTTGTVAAGDRLVTSSLSAGYLQTVTQSINTATNTVAIALSAGNANGALTRVKLK